MLKDCVSLVDAVRKQGRTLAQVQDAKVLQKYDALGQGFVKTNDFTALIYNELAGEAQKTVQQSPKHH